MPKAKPAINRLPNQGFLDSSLAPALHAYERLEAAQELPLVVLTIDPGKSNVALCCFNVVTGTIATTKVDLPDFKTTFAKFQYIDDVIRGWAMNYLPTIIVKEGVAHYMKFGVAEAGRMQHIVEKIAFDFNVPCLTINPSKMREFMNLKQGQDKQFTMLAVFERWGVKFDSSDETDAYALTQTALAALSGEFDLRSKKEQDAEKRAAKKAVQK